MSSLGDLLAAHGLVKVQLNAVNSDVHAVGRDLADGTGVAGCQSVKHLAMLLHLLFDCVSQTCFGATYAMKVSERPASSLLCLSQAAHLSR